MHYVTKHRNHCWIRGRGWEPLFSPLILVSWRWLQMEYSKSTYCTTSEERSQIPCSLLQWGHWIMEFRYATRHETTRVERPRVLVSTIWAFLQVSLQRVLQTSPTSQPSDMMETLLMPHQAEEPSSWAFPEFLTHERIRYNETNLNFEIFCYPERRSKLASHQKLNEKVKIKHVSNYFGSDHFTQMCI